MMSLTKEQIMEIAEQLDCGFRCFWNRLNGELLFFPDSLKHPDIDLDAWSCEMEKFDNNFDEYLEIENLESSDSFSIMADFADSLPDSLRLKSRLINALNKKKPFREFKFEIDNSGEYRQMWFDFKNSKLQEWVIARFNEMINLEK